MIIVVVVLFTTITSDALAKNLDISPRDECADIAPTERCKDLKDQGRCETWKFMQEKCMATCGLCGDNNDDDDEDENTESPNTEAPATTPEDTDDSTDTPPSTDEPTEPVECTDANKGSCECGDKSKGFTTYTFWIGDVQRCFTVFYPLSRAGEKLPVVLSPNCYAEDRLQGIAMTSATRGDNAAATKYGYSRIGLSTPDGHWTFGNDNIVNDEKPMPCSDEDSKDIPYLKTVFAFIESNSDTLDNEKIYAEGFSQNSMFSAYTAFCFHEKVVGVWQGGSGLALTGEKPFVPNKGAQCTASSFEEYGGQCMSKDPCTVCQYWPIYPCYTENRPMVHCIAEYTNDGVSVQEGVSSAEHMYEKSMNEGHDARLLRFDPSGDGTIEGGHKDPKNTAHWYVGCLGITEPCSSSCETSFTSCVNSKDVSTAEKRTDAFEDCIEDSENLSGCTAECAPTYNMLIESQAPITATPSTFGATTGSHSVRPDTSLCRATA